MQSYNSDGNTVGSSDGGAGLQSTVEYVKQVAVCVKISVLQDIFGSPTVRINKLRNDATSQRIYLNQSQWNSLKKLTSVLATAFKAGTSYHLTAKMIVTLSIFRNVEYVQLRVDMVKDVSSVFLTRNEWIGVMSIAPNIDAALDVALQHKVSRKRPLGLNVKPTEPEEPTAKLHRWAWCDEDKELIIDSSVGRFNEKACVEAAHLGRTKLVGVDVSELLLKTSMIDACDNSQDFMDTVTAHLCVIMLSIAQKALTCIGCGCRLALAVRKPFGCLVSLQEALECGEFDFIYDSLDMDHVRYVYKQSVAELKWGWTDVPAPNKQAVAKIYKEKTPILRIPDGPYQRLFMYHWKTYPGKQASSDDTDDANNSNSSAGDGV